MAEPSESPAGGQPAGKPEPGSNGKPDKPAKPSKAGRGRTYGRKGKATRPKVKSRNRSRSSVDTHAKAALRRQIMDLRARGLLQIEVAHRLGITKRAVEDAEAVMERLYHEESLQDWRVIRAQELCKLKMARDAAWEKFQTAANRHGETFQTGYLQAFLAATKQITDLQRLDDPGTLVALNAEMNDSGIHLQVIEIRSREELEAFQARRTMHVEEYEAFVAEKGVVDVQSKPISGGDGS